MSSPSSSNDDTVYYVASVSNIIAVCVVARLLHDGILDWDKPIHQFLPEFHRPKDKFGRKATLRDFASNRAGLTLANLRWYHMKGQPLLDTVKLIRILADIDTIKPFRSSFYHTARNCILIRAVVEKRTGKPFGQTVELILRLLGLKDFTFEILRKTNVAPAHAVRSDGSVATIPMGPVDSSTSPSASMGGKSTMNEVLRFFNELLSAYNYHIIYSTDATPGSPFA